MEKKLRSRYEGKVRIGGEGNEKKMGPGSEGTWKWEENFAHGKK